MVLAHAPDGSEWRAPWCETCEEALGLWQAYRDGVAGADGAPSAGG